MTTTDTHISDTITNTGTVVDTDITLVSTGATTDESVVSPSDRIVIQPRQSGRTLRQGKQFAYELANALEIGTGEMLTTIDGYYDTQTLYDAWEQTQDTQIYHALIDRLESEYQYDDMVALLASHTNLRTTDTPDRYVRAL
ncbi:MAG: hypothetical protein H6766_05425 [Candidatus Peribacteria bacterium]|nr:MAG: hypothetical protein H6766_05425 [Candidatus Peribacteria bacterium]